MKNLILFIALFLCACGTNQNNYSNSYSNALNNDINAENNWRNCYKNVSGPKIELVETGIFPDESIVGAKRYQEIKNLDKNLSPIQKEGMVSFNNEISWCDKVFANSISDINLKKYVESVAKQTEDLRRMLILGSLTIKEFRSRYDVFFPQNSNSPTRSNSSYNGSVYIPQSNASISSNNGSLNVPQTNAPIKSMGEAPKGYAPSTTASPFSYTPQQPIQPPTVTCMPIGGGFSCR
jgi:hypothetical protein